MDPEETDLSQMFSNDYVNHVTPEPPGGWKRGVECARQIIKAYRLSFPDLTLRVSNQVTSGDLVVTQYTIRGTHTARSFFGAVATGNTYQLSGLGVDRIIDGKFVESWGAWDTYGLMEQMGILPKMAHLSA
jgi:predicted ester cyclase